MHTDAELEETVRRVCAQRAQLLAHCNGDAAADQLISVFERENLRCAVAPLRPVMIHAQILRADQLDRMKPLGMIPSFFAAHLWYWGDAHRKNLGKRAFRISPLHDAAARGNAFHPASGYPGFTAQYAGDDLVCSQPHFPARGFRWGRHSGLLRSRRCAR